MAVPPDVSFVASASPLLAEGWGELGGVIFMLVIAFGGWIAGKIKEAQQEKDMPKRPKHKIPRAGGADEPPRRRPPSGASPPRARPPRPQRQPAEPVARPPAEQEPAVPSFPGDLTGGQASPPRRRPPAESHRVSQRRPNPPRGRSREEIEAEKQKALREIRRQTQAQASAKQRATARAREQAQAEMLVTRAPEQATGGMLDLPLDRDDLRRAIVLAEVLGPPVAERDVS